MERGFLDVCKYGCADRISGEECTLLFKRFYEHQTHSLQNAYLRDCVQKVPTARPKTMVNGLPSLFARRTFRYDVIVSGREIRLCQRCFGRIHGVKRSRLRRIVQQPEKSVEDKRGKHKNRPLATKVETETRVLDFLQGLPARVSHYSRSKNARVRYLDSNLNIKKLHEKFTADNVDIRVSYDKFCRLFNEKVNLRFGAPRSDLCETCEKFAID